MNKNGLMISVLVACAVGMVGAAYASVPLYRAFCQATGYGGTTQRASSLPSQASERWVTVSFDGNVDPTLPWDFTPEVKSMKVRLGEVVQTSFHARNRGNHTIVGVSTFNVQPDKVGSYFDKLQCFCFSRQSLKPGEAASLPVEFFVDPALADDRLADDVKTITLSYSFFQAKD
jgi:cytochrome c oxidase assembly protein subunit 11